MSWAYLLLILLSRSIEEQELIVQEFKPIKVNFFENQMALNLLDSHQYLLCYIFGIYCALCNDTHRGTGLFESLMSTEFISYDLDLISVKRSLMLE